jgi:hypothetical protein
MDLSTDDTVDVRMRKGSITLDDGDLGAVNKPTFFGYKVGYGDGAMNVDYVYETLPAFRSHYIQSNPVNFTANSRITLLTEIFDIGSNFDAGLFTAPSAGVYQFGVNYNNHVDSNGSGLTLRINGVNDTDLIEDDSTGYHNWKVEQGSGCIAYLNAGDTVDITTRHGTGLSMPAITASNAMHYGIKFWGFKVGYGDGVSIKTFTKSGSVAFYNDGNVGIGTETPAAKLDVAGDINCTSLGASLANVVIDATYPVGTIIDRATAITDTHSNGKYKAFLAAPNQEWQLVESASNTVPLEYLTQLGETTSYCGRATLTPATAKQSMSSAMSTITGTEITGLTPVVGTTKMKYVCTLAVMNGGDQYAFGTFRIQVKEDSGPWTEITKSNTSWYHDNHPSDFLQVHTVINFGDSTNDLTEGRTTTVRPTIGLRVLGRAYSSGYDVDVNEVTRFTTDNSTANTRIFKPPCIDVISVGSEGILKYRRTV